ncbi:MAG: acetyl ornithine aminotransferase family protein [Candidatus Hydrothermales bacterium]
MGPKINNMLPGKKAKKWLSKDKKFISPSYTRVYPLVVERGEGVFVYDVDGNKFLDFNAGVAVLTLGHSHPEVIEIAVNQIKKLIHYSGTDFYYPSEIKLAEKLAEIAPGAKNRKIFFSNSGAESVEAAIKLARYYTNRPYIVAFYGGFHGRTMGALSATASKTIHRKRFFTLFYGTVHAPYPYCFRCPINLNYPRCNFACIKFIEENIFSRLVDPEEVAAFIIEPIQGEGGYIPAPPGYFVELKKLLDKYNILLIVDEVQSGMGRTGKFFAIEHYDVIPDIITLAKGIASGFPLGASIARSGIMNWPPGTHASTFGGNPVSCEVALKVIEKLENGLLDHVRTLGEKALNEILNWKNEFEIVGDVRGKGLMIGIEIVSDKKNLNKDKIKRDKIVQECFKEGLLILPAGENVVRICPPLIINEEEMFIGLEILKKVIKRVSEEK